MEAAGAARTTVQATANSDQRAPPRRRPGPLEALRRSRPDFYAALPQYGYAAAAHLALLILWQVISTSGWVKPFILPSPEATFGTLAVGQYQWLNNTLVSAFEIFAGYALAVVVGVVLALLFTWFKAANATLFPLFVTLSMIPKIALGPLLVVWFGYGIATNIFFAFILAFFPILITTGRGLRETEPELLDLVRALKGTRWQIFLKIQFPGSLPYIFSSMKVGAILAVAGAIVGEFIAASQGLGYLMIQVQAQLDTAAMFMAVILLTLVGVVLFGVVLVFERIFVVRDARTEAASI
jgi:NitT/TauT family transport system permease protein